MIFMGKEDKGSRDMLVNSLVLAFFSLFFATIWEVVYYGNIVNAENVYTGIGPKDSDDTYVVQSRGQYFTALMIERLLVLFILIYLYYAMWVWS